MEWIDIRFNWIGILMLLVRCLWHTNLIRFHYYFHFTLELFTWNWMPRQTDGSVAQCHFRFLFRLVLNEMWIGKYFNSIPLISILFLTLSWKTNATHFPTPITYNIENDAYTAYALNNNNNGWSSFPIHKLCCQFVCTRCDSLSLSSRTMVHVKCDVFVRLTAAPHFYSVFVLCHFANTHTECQCC